MASTTLTEAALAQRIAAFDDTCKAFNTLTVCYSLECAKSLDSRITMIKTKTPLFDHVKPLYDAKVLISRKVWATMDLIIRDKEKDAALILKREWEELVPDLQKFGSWMPEKSILIPMLKVFICLFNGFCELKVIGLDIIGD